MADFQCGLRLLNPAVILYIYIIIKKPVYLFIFNNHFYLFAECQSLNLDQDTIQTITISLQFRQYK